MQPNMDQILQTLVTNTASNISSTNGNHHDLSSDMEDVMKVLTGFDDYDEDFPVEKPSPEKPSSKSEEKFIKVKNRQIELEKRFQCLNRRINNLRTRKFGVHVMNELKSIRYSCESLNPSLGRVPESPAPSSLLPKIDFDLCDIKPPPDGIVLPSVPVPQVSPSPKSQSDIRRSILDKIDISKTDEVLCLMEGSLLHLMESVDSDATESSSGGESCDEFDAFPSSNTNYEPISKRAKWNWLRNRASIASKWTWLTAQISDLEYRIRQQTEFYRQIRSSKGPIILDSVSSSYPSPPRSVVLLTDSSGRKISLKEPLSPETTNDGTSRCRPLKPFRWRKIHRSKSVFKELDDRQKMTDPFVSSFSCECLHPYFSCSLCSGKRSLNSFPNEIFLHSSSSPSSSSQKSSLLSMLDSSFHPVLSSLKQDVSLEFLLMEKISDRSWLLQKESLEGKNSSTHPSESLNKSKSKVKGKKSILTEETMFESEKERKKKKKRLSENSKRRKSSLCFNSHGESFYDFGSDEGNEIFESSSLAESNKSWMDHMRRKRESAYDIDNIVIPYSIASATRVEKLQYKEILTPTWRLLQSESESERRKESLAEEDVSFSAYETRHLKAELEEKKRWQTLPWKQTGGQRSRARRQDSKNESGTNTPDPTSPNGSDGAVTRPTTPFLEEPMSIRNRRRTSSANKSRSENPSRSSTPVTLETSSELVPTVSPFEPRSFPLSDSELESMHCEMPSRHSGDPQEPLISFELNAHSSIESSSSSTEDGDGDEENGDEEDGDEENEEDGDEEDEEDEDGCDPDWNGEDPDDPEWDSKASKTGKTHVELNFKLPNTK